MLVILDADQKALSFEIFDSSLAGFVAIHAAIFFGYVVIHLGGLGEHRDGFEVVALTHRKVIEVMRRRDLHAARAELTVNVFVSDHRNGAVAKRQHDFFTDQIFVAFVFRMHGNGLVTEKRFRTGRCDHYAFTAICGRIADFPEVTVFFNAFDFEVTHRALQFRVPVHKTGAAVNEAVVIKLHEGVYHHARELFVHGEVKTIPINRVAHAADLLQNRAA